MKHYVEHKVKHKADICPKLFTFELLLSIKQKLTSQYLQVSRDRMRFSDHKINAPRRKNAYKKADVNKLEGNFQTNLLVKLKCHVLRGGRSE